MTDQPTSFSFPRGAERNRTEAEARAQMNMAQLINFEARKPKTLDCPFCGAAPHLPANVLGRYVIECENDDCCASVSVAGDSPSDAVAKWNRRAT